MQPLIVQLCHLGFRLLRNDRNREFGPVNCEVLTFRFSICIHGTKQATGSSGGLILENAFKNFGPRFPVQLSKQIRKHMPKTALRSCLRQLANRKSWKMNSNRGWPKSTRRWVAGSLEFLSLAEGLAAHPVNLRSESSFPSLGARFSQLFFGMTGLYLSQNEYPSQNDSMLNGLRLRIARKRKVITLLD